MVALTLVKPLVPKIYSLAKKAGTALKKYTPNQYKNTGTEAYKHRKQTLDSFYNDFKNIQGREPNRSEYTSLLKFGDVRG